MAIIGAILGDIAGSRCEFHRPKDLDWEHIELFTDNCFFTDDTVLTVATKYALQNNFHLGKHTTSLVMIIPIAVTVVASSPGGGIIIALETVLL